MFEAVHAKRYAERMTAYLGLDMQSHVIEVASHDGHLLQHFSKLGIPVIGIEPTMPRGPRDEARGIRPDRIVRRDMAPRLRPRASTPISGGQHALFRVPDADIPRGFALLLTPSVATFEIAPSSCLTPQMAEQLFRKRLAHLRRRAAQTRAAHCRFAAAGTRRGNGAVGWLDADDGASACSLTGIH